MEDPYPVEDIEVECFLCFKLETIVSSALIHSSSLKRKNTQPLYIYGENHQNSEPQNGPRRGLDFIALEETNATLVIKF